MRLLNAKNAILLSAGMYIPSNRAVLAELKRRQVSASLPKPCVKPIFIAQIETPVFRRMDGLHLVCYSIGVMI